MSDADKAYEAAQRLIAEALADGRSSLDLDTKDTHALAMLPPEIIGLTGFTALYLANTQVTDLTLLSGPTGLTRLSLNNTPVTDLTPLLGLTGLKVLDLANTLVTDLTPLAGLTGLSRLSLNNTPVTDLTSLLGLTGLTRLYLDNTQVTDLTSLLGLTGLTRLYLANTQVTDLTPLLGLTGLTTLYLSNTQVKDLRPLLPLTSLVRTPAYGGLVFKGALVTQLDPKLAELSEIESSNERATKTFAYLREVGDDWPPNLGGAPKPPAQTPAPLQAEFFDGVLVERAQPSNLPDDTASRARQGWDALSEFHDDVVETLRKGNLPNLERAINAFGRALGTSFEDVRQIALGTHGQRIVEISKTAGDTLMDDAAGDLQAFAAAITTHLQRFPEWVAYLQDDLIEAAATPSLGTFADELRDLSLAFQDADFIASDLAQKFDDLVQAAEDKDLPNELAKKGVLGSLSNMLSPIAERAISATKRAGGDLGKEVYKRSVQASAIAVVGSVGGILITKGQILAMLAEKFPTTLGWLEGILRFLGV